MCIYEYVKFPVNWSGIYLSDGHSAEPSSASDMIEMVSRLTSEWNCLSERTNNLTAIEIFLVNIYIFINNV